MSKNNEKMSLRVFTPPDIENENVKIENGEVKEVHMTKEAWFKLSLHLVDLRSKILDCRQFIRQELQKDYLNSGEWMVPLDFDRLFEDLDSYVATEMSKMPQRRKAWVRPEGW